MHRFISPWIQETDRVCASITATSRSGKSQETARPDRFALAPLTRAVQSPPLSSIQRPWASFFTIRPTGGGGGTPPPMGGSKPAPSLGGGFCPPQGPLGWLTTLGGKPLPIVEPPPRIVEPLPDSNTAA